MQKISSRQTVFYKKFFPIQVIVILVIFAMIPKMDPHPKGPPIFIFYIFPLFFAVLMYFLYKNLISDLVDEVYDGGDFLLIVNKGREERIPLSNIKNVSYVQFANPKRVTLYLRRTSSFGDRISFSPKFKFRGNIFSEDPQILELINRIDRARQN